MLSEYDMSEFNNKNFLNSRQMFIYEKYLNKRHEPGNRINYDSALLKPENILIFY